MKKFFYIFSTAIALSLTTHAQLTGTDLQGRTVTIIDPLQWKGFKPETSKGRIADGFINKPVVCRGMVYIFESPIKEDLDNNELRSNVREVPCYIVRGGEVVRTTVTLTTRDHSAGVAQSFFNAGKDAIKVVRGKFASYYFNEPIALAAIQLPEPGLPGGVRYSAAY